jgi:DNA mismatch endonuclease (patch repair protein)
MSLVKCKDTKLEMVVRRLVYRLGFRYRLHVGNLPGKPDLVFVGLRKVIFVHGCFWHRHQGCGRVPKSRLEFWKPKLEQNRRRDLKNQQRLRRDGWRVHVIWECQLADMKKLERRMVEFLNAK